MKSGMYCFEMYSGLQNKASKEKSEANVNINATVVAVEALHSPTSLMCTT